MFRNSHDVRHGVSHKNQKINDLFLIFKFILTVVSKYLHIKTPENLVSNFYILTLILILTINY